VSRPVTGVSRSLDPKIATGSNGSLRLLALRHANGRSQSDAAVDAPK
jgi:hypothetical protein